MKHLLLLIFVIAFFYEAEAQNDSKSTNFIRAVIKNEKDSINYLNEIDKYYLKEIKEVLNHDTLISFGFPFERTRSRETLILTKHEKRFIQNKLDKEQSFFWKPGLLDNSNLIVRKPKGANIPSGKLNTISFKKVYTFSKPIFLRKNTICIFYNGYFCGMECGEGNLVVYRKENNQWKKWLMLWGWMS